jgi:hypothetical protein
MATTHCVAQLATHTTIEHDGKSSELRIGQLSMVATDQPRRRRGAYG